MIRVLVLSPFWPTTANPITGIFVVQQAEALRKNACDPLVMVPMRIPARHNAELQESSQLRVEAVSFLGLPERKPVYATAYRVNAASCFQAVRARLAALKEAWIPDVVHVHGVRPGAFIVEALKRHLGLPVVWTLHGRDSTLEMHLRSRTVRNLLRRAAAAADVVTTVGSPLRDYAELLGVSDEKLRVVPNGNLIPDLAFEETSRSPYFRLLSVSNLVQLKGIEYNLRAIALLRAEGHTNIRYDIVGDGPDRPRLEQLTADLGLREVVRFLGRLPYSETMAHMGSCDAFSLPSWGEAFGIVYLEAMARGKPAIGCLSAGAADIIRSGVDGFLVPPHDYQDLACTIRALASDKDVARTIGAHARSRAHDFSWDANAAAYSELYRAGLRACQRKI